MTSKPDHEVEPKPDDDEFERFEDLAKKLVRVPKRAIEKEREGKNRDDD